MYIDANIFIYATQSAGEKGESARRLLSGLTAAKQGVISPLVLDEVIWSLRKNGESGKIGIIIDGVYAMEHLQIVPLAADIPLRAVALMEQHKLKPRDAFHLATMHELGETTIASDDADFDRVPGLKRVRL
jgi:predicted nucleic acid-binding protein